MAFVPLIHVIRGEPWWSAAGIAWVAGIVASLAACSWWYSLIDNLTAVPAAYVAILTTLLHVHQAGSLALWGAIAAVLARNSPWMIAAPVAIVVAESWWPYVVPWHVGLIASGAWPLMQVAEFGGPVLVSAFVVLLSSLIADAFLGRSSDRRRIVLGSIAAGLLFCVGMLRAWRVESDRQSAPVARIGLVQPNFSPMTFEDRQQRGRFHLHTLREATKRLRKVSADLIVWPESAWPFLLDRNLTRDFPPDHPWTLNAVRSSAILFGALSHEFGTAVAHNSAILMGQDGRIEGRYDKRHLVPFAEYVPLGDRFSWWEDKVRSLMPPWPPLRAGEAPAVLSTGKIRVAPLICSEDLYPEMLPGSESPSFNLITSLANDAWLGSTWAQAQHLGLARFRAIEARREVVRATTTGASAIIDGLGRVVAAGEPWDGESPAAILVGDVRLLNQPMWVPHIRANLGMLSAAIALSIVAILPRLPRSSGFRTKRAVQRGGGRR